MKVSQLLHAMDREDDIIIENGNERIDRMTIYKGEVKGIKRDDPVNRMHVEHGFACDNVIAVLVNEARVKGATDERAE